MQPLGHAEQIPHPDHGPLETLDTQELDFPVFLAELPCMGSVDAHFSAFPYHLPARVAFDDFGLNLHRKRQRTNDKGKACAGGQVVLP